MSEKLGQVPWIREDSRPVTRLEIKCDCGQKVLCARFTNTCSCGADYNMNGSLLASREQWGETGESVNDILRADFDDQDGW